MGRRLCIFGFCRSIEMLSDVVEDTVLEHGGEVCPIAVLWCFTIEVFVAFRIILLCYCFIAQTYVCFEIMFPLVAYWRIINKIFWLQKSIHFAHSKSDSEIAFDKKHLLLVAFY